MKGGAHMGANNSVLTRVFTQNMLRDLMYDCNDAPLLSNIVKRYEIKYNGDSKNENIISEIYQYLGSSYRNEYFYKNTIFFLFVTANYQYGLIHFSHLLFHIKTNMIQGHRMFSGGFAFASAIMPPIE